LRTGTKFFFSVSRGKIHQCSPYYGQHINVLRHFIYVSHGWGKQLEVAVSLNNNAITSYWVNK
jgi:hypothetical protein